MQLQNLAFLLYLYLLCISDEYVNCQNATEDTSELVPDVLDILIHRNNYVMISVKSAVKCVAALLNPLWILTTSVCISLDKRPDRGDMVPGASINEVTDYQIFTPDIINTQIVKKGSFIPAKLILFQPLCEKNAISNHSLVLMKLYKPLEVPENFTFARIPSIPPEVGTKCKAIAWKSHDSDGFYGYLENEQKYMITDVSLTINTSGKCGYQHIAFEDSPSNGILYEFFNDKLVSISTDLNQTVATGSPLICNNLLQGLSAKIFSGGDSNGLKKMYHTFWPISNYKRWIVEVVRVYRKNSTMEFVLSRCSSTHSCIFVNLLIFLCFNFINQLK